MPARIGTWRPLAWQADWLFFGNRSGWLPS